MQSITAVGLVVLSSVVFITALDNVPETTTVFSLNPSAKTKFKPCTTKLGIDGRCVHSSFCNDMKYEIEHGGIIIEKYSTTPECEECGTGDILIQGSNLVLRGRNASVVNPRAIECNMQTEWCCSEKNVTQLPPPKPEQQKVDCILTNQYDCPWCVKLYRDGIDRRLPESGFFCMGTMIGPNVILSTGTCMIQAHKQNITAVVPSSANPTAKYLVSYRILHPKYNSGTRANDLAIFVVHREVEWDSTGPKGACIGLSAQLTGDCIGAGVDEDENIDLTPLLVKSGNCGRGESVDAACGYVIGNDCAMQPGAPIMCRVKDGALQMVGFSKVGCSSDTPKVLLGHLNVEKKWLDENLRGVIGLERKTFTNEGF